MNHPAKTSLRHAQEVDVPLPITVHPSVSAKAAALLEGTIEMLLRSPERYDQGEPCGSTCCIIGWMRQLAGLPQLSWGQNNIAHGRDVGLTSEQTQKIYLSLYWPKQFITPEAWQDASKTDPSDAIARIEHFLRTGE